MADRQLLQPMPSTVNDVIEDVACGWVNHRFKGYKTKRRWGQLLVSLNTSKGIANCTIQLYKDAELSPTSLELRKASKKEPKKKFELHFTRAEFCGIEKGEHHDRYGTRRYLCIITKMQHLIIEDAVMTTTGLNHNILGTWYQRIAEVMLYFNRWRIIEKDPKLASSKVCYFHVGSENTSECHSLEDKTRDNREKLVLRSWRTKELSEVREHMTVIDDRTTTDVTFQVQEQSGVSSLVRLSVEGPLELRKLVEQARRNAASNRKPTSTICEGFDDINCSPNLVKLPPTKKLSKALPGNGMAGSSSSSKMPGSYDGGEKGKGPKLGQAHNHQGNLYVRLPEVSAADAFENRGTYQNLPNGHNMLCVELPRDSVTQCMNGRPGPSSGWTGGNGGCNHGNPKVVVPPSLAGHSPTRSITPEFISFGAHGGLNSSPSPPHFPSSPLDGDNKKAPGLETQTSFDSAYNTAEFTALSLNEHYMNLSLRRGSSDPDFSRRHNPAVYQNLNAEERAPALPARDVEEPTQPYVNVNHRNSFPSVERTRSAPATPPIPPKDYRPTPTEPSRSPSSPPIYRNQNPPLPPRPSVNVQPTFNNVDPLRQAIDNQSLPPLPSDPDALRAYENSSRFETTINEVLQQTHWSESRNRWLDLPHSVFLCIALGLEKDEAGASGDWKAFAEELGLTFQNIQQLSGLMRSHPTLRPVEVVLLHWCRMQPIPFTRANLRSILIKIQRWDLAEQIPFDEARRTSNSSR